MSRSHDQALATLTDGIADLETAREALEEIVDWPDSDPTEESADAWRDHFVSVVNDIKDRARQAIKKI